MNFSKAFRFSLAAHVSIFGTVFVLSFLHGCITKKPQDIPMFDLISGDAFASAEAVVEDIAPTPEPQQPPVPPPPPLPPPPLPPPPPIVDDEADALIQKPDPPKPEPPKPEPPKPPPPKPEPPPKKPIVPSTTRVTRDVPTPAPTNTKPPSFADTRTPVDPNAIRGAINVGTPTQGNAKLAATETQRINNAIREALKNEWGKEKEKVGALEGSQPPRLEITFAADGRVTAANVTTSSGSKIFDDAAKRSALRVRVPTDTAWSTYLRENKNKAIIIFNF